MTGLAFTRTDPASDIATAFVPGGRLMLIGEALGSISSLRYALAIPEGMTARDVETAHQNAVEGSPEQIRLRQTMPFFGITIGWFTSTDDAEAVLTAVAQREDLPDAETQLRQAGFKPYLCLDGGKKVYARHLTDSASSNAFHLMVGPDGVDLTFERASRSEPLLTLTSGDEDGEGRHAVPAFLANPAARVACAIAQADRALATGRTRRLALEVAYLRLAARECGMSLNIRWGRGITPLLDRMIAAGDLDRRRMPAGGRKTVTTVFATPRGLAKLTGALARFGDGFGPVVGLVRIEPVRRRKDTPPLTGRTPTQARRAALCQRQALERARAKRLAA